MFGLDIHVCMALKASSDDNYNFKYRQNTER